MITDPPPDMYSLPDNYYLDYMTSLPTLEPDFSSYKSTRMEAPQADDTIGDSGNCSWEWSLSATDVEGNPLITGYDFIGPWRSWFRLRSGKTVIMAGPITGIKGSLSEQFMTVTGKTWEGYFPQWQYPFDPRPDHVNDYSFPSSFIGNELVASGSPTPQGLVYQAYQRDLILIAGDIFSQVMNSVGNRMTFDISELADTVGILTNYQYTLADDSGLDSFMTNLASVGEGFDWWIGWDRKVHIGSPYRYGSSLSPNIVYFVDVTTPGLIDLEYDNDGIQGTHVLGLGAGLAVQTQLGAAFGYEPVQEEYSRLDISFNYGDIRNQSQLDRMTKKSLSLIIDPVRTVTLTLDPSQITDYWKKFRKGRAIYITVDTGFHQVNAPYKIRNWSLSDEEDTGNMLVTLTCDRIYPEVADFGNAGI